MATASLFYTNNKRKKIYTEAAEISIDKIKPIMIRLIS